MEYVEEYLLKALSGAVKKDYEKNPIKEIDYKNLLKKAEEHKIHTLIFPVVENIKGEYAAEKDFLNHWRNLCFVSGIQLVRLEETLNKIIQKLNENQIDVILLKGAVLKELYPNKEARTMGDIDIIVKEKDKEKLIEIFSAFSYEPDYDSHGNLLFKSKNNFKFEAFYQLSTISSVWEHVVPYHSNDHVFRLSNEMTLFHLISHLGKHLRYKGAGVRNLADIYLVMENYELDYVKLFIKLKENGLYKLFLTIVELLRIYFDFKKDLGIKEKTDQKEALELMEFMMKYGVYGVGYDENVFFVSQRSIGKKKNARLKSFIKKIFPPAYKLSDKYAYAKKYPILLFIAWIHRIINKRVSEKITISQSVKDMKNADQSIQYQIDILKKLDL